jgi:thiol-disulfide isomerase/thioredoxin
MNKKFTLISIGIAAVIIAAVIYVMMRPDRDMTAQYQEPTPPPAQEETPAQPSEQPAQAQPGTYIAYNAETVANTSGRKILFFHAPWCPQCRALEKSINEDTIPSGVTIFKTDYDTNHELRLKYGVPRQTALVEIDDNGQLIQRHEAYANPSLPAVITAMEL